MQFPITVGIFVYDRVELVDLAGPYEVFFLSGSRNSPTPGAFEVKLIAVTTDPITTRGGLRLLPDYSIDNHPSLEILIVPGGPGVNEHMLQDQRGMEWLRTVETRYAIASVASGALLLAEAGRLDGYTATSNAENVEALNEYAEVEVEPDKRFVDMGNVLTSSGISAAIDMSLHLVRRLVGQETMLFTTQTMEYEHRAQLPSL